MQFIVNVSGVGDDVHPDHVREALEMQAQGLVDLVDASQVTVELAPDGDVKVQMVHWRDPDSECSTQVFVNDVATVNVEVEDIDPGRGWQWDEWLERIQDAAGDESAYGKAVHAALMAAAESQYIQGKPDNWRSLATGRAVALILTRPGADPVVTGMFLGEIDAREWLARVQTMCDPSGVAAGYYTIETIEVSSETIMLSLDITNTYEDGVEIATQANNILVPMPPDQDDSPDLMPTEYDEWVQEHIIGWTGTGRTGGDSWYDVTVTYSSHPYVIPVGQKYDFGY